MVCFDAFLIPMLGFSKDFFSEYLTVYGKVHIFAAVFRKKERHNATAKIEHIIIVTTSRHRKLWMDLLCQLCKHYEA